MKAKNWILFLALSLLVQISCKTIPVLAQEDKNSLEVKKVIEEFVKGITYRDLNSVMQYVSVNYSVTIDGKVKDYNTFKSELENNIKHRSENYVDFSMSELKYNNLDIQDNKATIEIEWDWKGYNLHTLSEDSGKRRRATTLAKENGLWKITQWRRLSD